MSRQYDHWVFMQEEPHWEHGPTGRPAKETPRLLADPNYVPFELSRLEQLRIEDEIIARHIEYLERHKAG